MPRLRRIALAAALISSGGAAAGAALAADREVVARNNAFTPATVALQPGDTLTIRHDDRLVEHELKFSDEATKRQEPGTAGPCSARSPRPSSATRRTCSPAACTPG